MKYKVILFDVNKETHDIITKETINDENELYSLCYKNGWNIEWYDFSSTSNLQISILIFHKMKILANGISRC